MLSFPFVESMRCGFVVDLRLLYRFCLSGSRGRQAIFCNPRRAALLGQLVTSELEARTVEPFVAS